MTPAEKINDEARFWLKMYRNAAAEAGNPEMYKTSIATRVSILLCSHIHVERAGTKWYCLDCNGRSY